MQLEDPRVRYRQLQNERASNESIPMQPMHGSPYHVYPTNNYPAVQAFQGPSTTAVYNMTSSPLLSNRTQHMEMSPVMRHGSITSHTPRIMSQLAKQHIPQQQQQETSFITQAETDAAVTKINTMFPTASEPHIRLLLKKYLKSIFPKAEETLLLDILANADNNVQIASEKLIAMGYEKRDTTAPKLTNRNKEEQVLKERKIAENTPPPVPKIRTNEEKNKIKVQLQAQYSDVAERIIVMALESVDYSVDRACQILKIVMQDDKSESKTEKITVTGEPSLDNKTTPSKNHRSPPEEECDGNETGVITPKSVSRKSEFQSVLDRVRSCGPNTEMYRGPNDDILLVDYITWNGANPDLCAGTRNLAIGADSSLRTGRSVVANGPNHDLYTGPKGLAKGSIYSQINRPMANVKCN